jgi:hypothetical protein
MFFSDATPSSRYRRLQRFFANFSIDYDKIAAFIFKLYLRRKLVFNTGSDELEMGYGSACIKKRKSLAKQLIN